MGWGVEEGTKGQTTHDSRSVPIPIPIPTRARERERESGREGKDGRGRLQQRRRYAGTAQQRRTGWLAACVCLSLAASASDGGTGTARPEGRRTGKTKTKTTTQAGRHLSDDEESMAPFGMARHVTHCQCQMWVWPTKSNTPKATQRQKRRDRGPTCPQEQNAVPSTSISTKKEATEFITSTVSHCIVFRVLYIPFSHISPSSTHTHTHTHGALQLLLHCGHIHIILLQCRCQLQCSYYYHEVRVVTSSE